MSCLPGHHAALLCTSPGAEGCTGAGRLTSPDGRIGLQLGQRSAQRESLSTSCLPQMCCTQIDLVDLGNGRDPNFRYILVIIDLFTRHAWLRPLPSKHGILVAREVGSAGAAQLRPTQCAAAHCVHSRPTRPAASDLPLTLATLRAAVLAVFEHPVPSQAAVRQRHRVLQRYCGGAVRRPRRAVCERQSRAPAEPRRRRAPEPHAEGPDQRDAAHAAHNQVPPAGGQGCTAAPAQPCNGQLQGAGKACARAGAAA